MAGFLGGESLNYSAAGVKEQHLDAVSSRVGLPDPAHQCSVTAHSIEHALFESIVRGQSVFGVIGGAAGFIQIDAREMLPGKPSLEATNAGY
jgi:hypothetical protein